MAGPDVLVILSDQQRPDTIGVYGQRLAVTPTIDALAGQGTVFDRAFCVNPVCGPSRAAMQTGQRPTGIGCWRNGLALPPDTETLATHLAGQGYATGYVGKWHLASNLGPRLPGDRPKADFNHAAVPRERRGGYSDVWVGADALELTSGPYSGHVWDEDGTQITLSGYRVDAIADIAVDRLRRLSSGDRPFLLFVSFLEPHHQNNRFRTIGPKGWARRYREFDVPGDLRGTLGDWRWNYAQSLAAAASIDAAVARFVDVLDSSGRKDRTLVVYSSDHGSHFRTRNLEYKRSCHDASIHVPLVITGPGFEPARRDDRLVTHLDLLPTLLHATAAPAPDHLEGRPLQSTATRDAFRRDNVLVQISESQIGRALRTDRYTYAAAAPGRNPFRGHLAPAADSYTETHFYDLHADPYQRRNLAGTVETAEQRATLARDLGNAIEAAEGRRATIRVR